MQIHLVWKEIGRKIKWFEKQTTEHIKSESITLIETEDVTLLEEMPGSMLGSHACRAAGYCTESCLQNIFAILYFVVHGEKPRRCYFFMKLWWAWLMLGIRLAAPYGGFRVAYLQIQGQPFRGAHSQLSKHSAAKLQAWLLTGPGIRMTEREPISYEHPTLTGWFLSQQICLWQKLRQLNAVFLT